MISHVYDAHQFRYRVFENALDTLSQGHRRHTASLASTHQPEIGIAGINGNQLGGTTVGGNRGVDLLGEDLLNPIGQRTRQIALWSLDHRGGRSVRIVHRQTLLAQVERRTAKLVDVLAAKHQGEAIVLFDDAGPLVDRAEGQLVLKVTATKTGDLDEKTGFTLAGFLVPQLLDHLESVCGDAHNRGFAHDPMVTRGPGFAHSPYPAAVARVLIVLPTGSYRAREFIAAAAALDVEIAIASEEAPPLGLEDRFVRIDCQRPESSAEALADLAATTPIDAIIAADDTGVVVAAMVSEKLGLRGNAAPAAAATRNKAMMRRALSAAEVNQPSFEVISDNLPGLAYPVVIKPLSMNASKGVIRANDPDEAAQAIETIRKILATEGINPSEPLLAETYVDGPEVAVEGILWDGELEVLAVFDKPDPLTGPYFEETILVTPSRLDATVLADVTTAAGKAARALGLSQGPIHAELRVENGRPVVIEVAARTVGGLCGRSLTFGLLDTPLEVLVMRHALGMRKTGMRRSHLASGVMMIPIPHKGTLVSVSGVDAARAVAGITEIELTAHPGTRLAPPPEGDRYLGFIFARAKTPAHVETSLRLAHSMISISINP